jgi:hypothetical protein
MEGIPHAAQSRFIGAKSYRHFIMPGQEIKTQSFTILAGLDLKMGSVLGMITASGKLKLSASAAGDGSEVPMAILGEDVNTLSPVNADAIFAVYVHCKVNPEALILGAGHTIASITAALRDRGIYLEAPF